MYFADQNSCRGEDDDSDISSRAALVTRTSPSLSPSTEGDGLSRSCESFSFELQKKNRVGPVTRKRASFSSLSSPMAPFFEKESSSGSPRLEEEKVVSKAPSTNIFSVGRVPHSNALFPRKLREMCETEAHASAITWDEEWGGVVIRDPIKLREQILPGYFLSKGQGDVYKSFRRQLVYYGFEEITRGKHAPERLRIDDPKTGSVVSICRNKDPNVRKLADLDKCRRYVPVHDPNARRILQKEQDDAFRGATNNNTKKRPTKQRTVAAPPPKKTRPSRTGGYATRSSANDPIATRTNLDDDPDNVAAILSSLSKAPLLPS